MARLVDANKSKEDAIEISLRPQTLKEYVGQAELKDNLKKFALPGSDISIDLSSATSEQSDSFNDAVAAMTALGYRESDSVKYVKAVVSKDRSLSTQQIIVAALALISKGKS